jgi:hypothetical protein
MGIDPVSMSLMAMAAGASVVGGIADNAGARKEAKQYEENAKIAKLSAEQSAAERQRDLVSTLSSIRAITTSRGLDPTSPTQMAFRERLTSEAGAAMSTDRLNSLNQQSQYHTAASVSRARGRASLLKGFLNAGAYGAQAFQKPGVGYGSGGGTK